MKKIISILLVFIMVFCNLSLLAFAQNTTPLYSDDKKEFIYMKYIANEHMFDALFNDDTAIGYWRLVNDVGENGALSWSIDIASKLIGEYPDKQKYAEILANLITMQSGGIAEQVQTQSRYDNLKDGMDYAMDIIGIAADFVGDAGLLESISPIIDAATGGAEVIIDSVEQAKYYETTIRDYSQSKMFLEAVSQYAENTELQEVASSLIVANDSLLEKRLEYLSASAAGIAEYEAKFFNDHLSFALLKTADLYKTDETVKWYVDCGEKLSDSISAIWGMGTFAFNMTMLAGDIGFGTSDTFNRYQEMKIVSDVAGAIVEANSKIVVPEDVDAGSVLPDIQVKCDYYKMLVTVHARGEYLIYQLLVNDAGLLSDFQVLFDCFKDPKDTTDSWYEGQINCLTEYYDILNKMFTVSKADVSQGGYDTEDISSDAVSFNGHWYKLFNDSMTWEAAREYCVNQGGYLATITSQDEQDFISDLILDQEKRSYWIGLSDEEQSGNWKWANDEIFTYSNWAQNEPNHGYGGKEHYVAVVSYDTKYDYPIKRGEWNDHANDRELEQFGFICEWGEYIIAPNIDFDEPIRTTSAERDIVLVLDVSGSMSGMPIEETKKASTNFVDTVLAEDASIGIVTYDSTAQQMSDFSVDGNALKEIITGISSGGGTNIDAGLSEAYAMLRSSSAKKRIIVLMSDGEPGDGRMGDELIAYADEIKASGIIIYTLGFFEGTGSYKSAAQQLMEDIASDGCHYEVASADDLVFFFEDMADQINGQKYIYIRIACPVDVTVTHNGETLCSAEDNLNVRTDFGTLTFEDNENVSSASEDDRIKVLRLKEGVAYDVKIEGTGHGLMDYTIGFMDENGEYSDFRRFEDVKITRRTVIDTVASIGNESVLKIDEDGDGKYDLRLRAEENGVGEEIKGTILPYVVIGGGALTIILISIFVIQKKQKNKRKKEIS